MFPSLQKKRLREKSPSTTRISTNVFSKKINPLRDTKKFIGIVRLGATSNIYICNCFSVYDINNKIDIQFCMNTSDHVIFFFSNAYEYNILASVYLGHCTTFTCIVLACTEENT